MNEGSIPTENIDNPALFYGADSKHGPVAKFKVPDREYKVDSGIGLLYRATRLHRLAGRYDNLVPTAEVKHSCQNTIDNTF